MCAIPPGRTRAPCGRSVSIRERSVRSHAGIGPPTIIAGELRSAIRLRSIGHAPGGNGAPVNPRPHRPENPHERQTSARQSGPCRHADDQTVLEGTKAGELRLQRCNDCQHHFLYPRLLCPQCGSSSTTWVKASGQAKLYSYVINHMPAPGWEAEVPYVIAMVQLAEGPRMMSSLSNSADPARLTLDMPLQVCFEPRGDMMLPVFEPAGSRA